jgi:hypothetical protein
MSEQGVLVSSTNLLTQVDTQDIVKNMDPSSL